MDHDGGSDGAERGIHGPRVGDIQIRRVRAVQVVAGEAAASNQVSAQGPAGTSNEDTNHGPPSLHGLRMPRAAGSPVWLGVVLPGDSFPGVLVGETAYHGVEMRQGDEVFRHRTASGTFLGSADGRPLRLGRLRHLIIQLSEHRHAFFVFTLSRFRATYRAQALGLLWPVANPTILMIVMSVFFGLIFPPDVKAYPVFLLLGLVPWHFLSHAWTDGTTCLLHHAAVIKRTSVPAYVVAAGTVSSHIFNLGFASLSLLPLIAFYPEAFQVSLAMLALPVVIAILVCLGLGVTLLTSILNVVYRDVGYIVNSFLLVLFWATPIIYPLHKVPEEYQYWMLLNPMASLIYCVRVIILDGSFPPARAFWPALLVSLGILLLGSFVYRRFSNVVSDHV